jgi:hypothetical protein
MAISANQKNCNRPVSKSKFLPGDKKQGDTTPMTNSGKPKINTTFANTDNKVHKLVTLFA